MAQWGSSDASSNAVYWAPDQLKVRANTTTRDALYGNTTQDAFITGVKVGMFAVDKTEEGVSTGGLATTTVTYSGSGYSANATITVSGNGTANAHANATGKIDVLKISAAGSGYTNNPTVTIAAPANTTFSANTTSVTGGTGGGANSTIALSTAAAFVANDPITYRVAAGNTAISPLVSGTKYYVQFANATVVALSTTAGGARITLVPGADEAGHALQGDTATGVITVGGAANKGIPHTGWVLRTEGTGGRAGRVTYEVLVAGGIVSDGSDDTILPDA